MTRNLSLILAVLLSRPLVAQTEDKSDEIQQVRHARMLQLAKSYTFMGIDEPAVKLREQPVFSWTNPEVKSIGGELYLWTAGGRPIAAIGIWTYDDKTDSFELQSLATHGFNAESQQGVAWHPRVAGLQFKRLENEPSPDKSAVRRQVQMRDILRRRFSGEITKRDNNQIEKLRLLPQPIYRYDPLPKGLLDGAIFSLAYGTDPEIFVMLEAHPTENSSEWRYAFAPSTSRQARGYLDGAQAWDNSDQAANATFVFVRR